MNIARIAQWYERPLAAREVPSSSAAMENEEFVHEYFLYGYIAVYHALLASYCKVPLRGEGMS